MRRQQKLGSLDETFDPNSLIVKGIQRYKYIPIDFIKCKVINFPKEKLLNNPILNFMSLINEDTGEVKNKRFAYYKNIKIIIADSGYIEFEDDGSFGLTQNTEKGQRLYLSIEGIIENYMEEL
jgi:hypothetical protein